jgi:heptosyltransferase I
VKRVLLIQLARLGDLVQSLPLRDALLATGAAQAVDLLAAFEPRGALARDFHRCAVLDAGLLGTALPLPQRMALLRQTLAALDPPAEGRPWERVIALNDSVPAQALARWLPARLRQGPGMPGDPARHWLRALVQDRRGNRLLLAEVLLSALPGVETPAPRVRAPRGGAVLVHPGSGSPARRLPRSFWLQLLAGLRGGLEGRTLALTGGPGEEAFCASLLAELPAGHGVADLSGRLDLAELQRELAAADLLIAQDTGVLHLAARQRTPVLGLYHGSATLNETGPFLAGALALEIRAECHPCLEGRPDCGDYACRGFIDATDAVAAAKRALGLAVGDPGLRGTCRLLVMGADAGGASARPLGGDIDPARRLGQLALLRGIGGRDATQQRRERRLAGWITGGRPRRDWLRLEGPLPPTSVEEHWLWQAERRRFGRTG